MKCFFSFEQAYFILGLVKRDIAMRFRGSLLGALWLVINPLFSLALYYVVFSMILEIRWSTIRPDGAVIEHSGALSLFTGLIAFMFFSECLLRAPGLMRENTNYVKKVVFPLETLPIVIVLSSLFTAVVNLCLLLIFYLFAVGLPSWHIVFIPFIFLTLAIGCLGIIYGLSAFGVYVPDLKSLMGTVSMMFMFLTPIMYPLNIVPETLQTYIKVNPLTVVVENLRLVLFEAEPPSVLAMLALAVSALAFYFLGYFCFQKLRKGFADVI